MKFGLPALVHLGIDLMIWQRHNNVAVRLVDGNIDIIYSMLWLTILLLLFKYTFVVVVVVGAESILWTHVFIQKNTHNSRLLAPKKHCRNDKFYTRKKHDGTHFFLSSFIMCKWFLKDNFLFLHFNFCLKCEFNNQTASFICRNVISNAESIYFQPKLQAKKNYIHTWPCSIHLGDDDDDPFQ